MIKRNRFKVTLVFLFSLFFLLPFQSKAHKYFIISGKIVGDSVNIQNCTVEISSKDNKTFTSPVSDLGLFRFELEYNNEYKLVFLGSGGSTKTIIVHTQIPPELMDLNQNLPNFLVAVRLVNDDPIFTPNIQEIAYSPEKKCFTRLKTAFDYQLVERSNSFGKIR